MEDDTERVLGDYLLYTCGNFSVNSFLASLRHILTTLGRTFLGSRLLLGREEESFCRDSGIRQAKELLS